MDKRNDKIDGPYRIDQDLDFGGMITDQAIVSSGVEFILHGMVTGELIAEAGSRVSIHGMVNGTVHNRGGHIEIFGMIDDLVESGGTVMIAPGAVVRGPLQGKL